MKRNVFYLFIFIGFICFGSCKNAVTGKPEATGGIQWLTIDEGLTKGSTAGKKILVQIETDSCKWCDIMHDKTYSNETLAAFINENLIPIRFNTLFKDSLEFRGKKYGPKKIGRLDIHELAEEWMIYNYTYPTTIIMDPGFNQLVKFTGAKDPDQFLLELKKM